MLRAFRQEAMVVALAVPEAAPAALGAGRAEEGASGLDDPHGAECNGEGVPASRAGCQWGGLGLRFLQRSAEGRCGSLHADGVRGGGYRRLLYEPRQR